MYEAYAPLPRYRDLINQIGEGVDLGHSLSIMPLPEAARHWLLSDKFSYSDREQSRDARFAIKLSYDTQDHTDNLREKISLANLALWIAKPSRMWFESTVFLDLSHASPFAYELRTDSRIIPFKSDLTNELDGMDFDKARCILDGLYHLPHEGSLWTSVQLVWRALTDNFWATRFVVFWVVMEALYGPSDGQKIRATISNRVSRFVAGSPMEADDLLKWAKEGYKWRSRVVHGVRVVDADGTRALHAELADSLTSGTEDVLRRSFTKILSSEALMAKFDCEDRENLLDGS